VDSVPCKLALVTGGTGFVGSHLVDRLVALDVPVRCLVRKTSSFRYLRAGAVELVHGELATGAGLSEAVEGADVVFHVAGTTKAHSETGYYDGNLRGTENLLRACERTSTPPRRFVHVSSLAAIGPSADGVPLSEEAEPRPLTWYGRSKLASEAAVRASALAPRAVILRPPVVYGPRDTDVFEVFRSVAKGVMVLIGRGESWFSYIHVKDLVEALLAGAARERAAGGTYNIANPEPVSWTAFARTAASVMGRTVRFVRVPVAIAYAAGWCAEAGSRLRRKPGIISRQKVIEARCRYWTSNPSLARAELGWCAARPLQDGIAETLAWYKDAKWLKF
jgi:nucleoside-diphosphate-sugar epimerase